MSAAQQAAPESMDKAAPLGATMEAAVPAPPGYAEEAYAPIGTSTGVAPVGSTGAIPALTTVDGKPIPKEEESEFMREMTESISHMNPLPQDMDNECEKAGETLDNLMNNSVLIPKSILDRAKGLAILHVVKAAWGWSGRAGSGVVVAKLPDGSWSAPCAIAMAGAGWGAQVGVSITDFVFVITSEEGVKAFSRGFNVQFGINIEVSIGPWGRAGEVDIVLSDFAPIYTYSKSKGLFAGISLEGTLLFQRGDCNKAKYGEGVTGEMILKGQVPRPANSDHLYNSLATLDNNAATRAKEAAAAMKPTSAAPDF